MSEEYRNKEEKEDVIDEVEDDSVDFQYDITNYGADYPVDSIVNRVQKETIFIPHFQREYVWNIKKASRFIESLLLGLPVPGIFLAKEPDTGRMLVIDGQQRIKTLQFFYEGLFEEKSFKLKDVDSRFEGKDCKSLDSEDRLRLDNSIIHVTIIKQEKPSNNQSSVFHIFERLNTGGMLLRPQEIRACIYHGKFNELLKGLSHEEDWKTICNITDKRLKSQELILRFFALFFESDRYKPPLKEFLNNFMGRNRNLHCYSEELLVSKFKNIVKLVSKCLNGNAFRPEKSLNAAVYDGVMVGLARRLEKNSEVNEETFKKRYYALLKDEDFIDACSTGTSQESKVKLRIDKATKIFENI